jgi:pimeloyl-ACP methyl ester carboxylesterase
VPELRVRGGGATGPLVLLLHGLGATADVWDGLGELLGDRAWAAPDLPGHGGSAPLPSYGFPEVAAAVAHLVEPAGTVVLGHSFGGVVGLHLAAAPGVLGVAGLGIKVAWTAEELARAAALAARPPAEPATRAEALARHLRLSGLEGLVDPGDPRLDAGVVQVDGGWRPALDLRAFGAGDPAVAALVAAAPVPVVLARGEADHMVSREQLAAVVPDPVELPGLGHNAHVEDPAALLPLLDRLA